MALILVTACRDWVCPECWDFCDDHDTTYWQTAAVCMTELVVHARKRDYEPVGLAWIDVRGVLVA